MYEPYIHCLITLTANYSIIVELAFPMPFSNEECSQAITIPNTKLTGILDGKFLENNSKTQPGSLHH